MTFQDLVTDHIDDRIAKAHAGGPTRMGTVTSVVRESSQVYVQVDGTTGGVPCKTYANVQARIGDRVGLVKFGSDWIIVGTYGQNWQRFGWVFGNCVSGTTSSGTAANIPGPIWVPIDKEYDTSTLFLWVRASCYATAVGTVTWWLNDTTGAQQIGAMEHNLANVHFTMTMPVQMLAAHPAGHYDIYLQWAGFTSTMTMDAFDQFEMLAIESR